MLLDERIRLSVCCSRRWSVSAAALALVGIAALSLVTLRPIPAAKADEQQPTTDHDLTPMAAPAESGKTPLVQTAAADAGAAVESRICISGVCLDQRKKPIADARVRLFRSEHSSTPVVFDSQRMKISTGLMGGPPVPDQMNLGGAQLFYDPKSQRLLAEARSDAEGKVHFDDVLIDKALVEKASLLQIVAQSPGRATYVIDAVWQLGVNAFRSITADDTDEQKLQTIQDGAKKVIEMTMPKAATLRGRLVDEDGKPVAGATVIGPYSLANPVPGINCAISDAEGQYEVDDLQPFNIDELPMLLPELLPFSVQYVSAAASVRHPKYADDVAEFRKLPAEADVVLKRPAALSGTVTMSESGQRAAGTLVGLMLENGMIRSVSCDNDGRFLLASLPPGKCSVHAELYGERPPVQTSAVLEAGANRLDLKLTPGGFIKGRIVDDKTGKPLAGPDQINVVAVTGEGEAARSATGYKDYKDGTFSFAVPPGHNRIQIFASPWYRLIDADHWSKDGIDVAEEQTVEIELHVGPTLMSRLIDWLQSN